MINLDDIDPPKPVEKKLDFSQMSIGELRDHIISLQEEIARAQAMIESKETHRAGLEGLFKS